MTDNGAAGPSNFPNQVLNQFKEFCDVDTTVARDFLEKSAWNLEEAIHQYFQANENVTFNEGINSRRTNNMAINNNQNKQPTNAVALPNEERGGLYGCFKLFRHYLITVPLQLFYLAVSHAFSFVCLLLGNPRLSVTDPRSDVLLFLEEIVGKQEGSDRVTFVNGSYDDALRRAKRNVQCLVVYLHSPMPQCDDFLKSVILTDRFCALLQRNDALLWGASTRSEEGRRVATALRLISYPALGLITCVPGGNMACILRMSGNEMRMFDGVLNTLQIAFDENLPHLSPLFQEKAERERNSQLIREQELDYARSLAADKAKREERLRLEEDQKTRERQEQEEVERLNEKKNQLAMIRERIRAQIPAQATPLNDSVSSEGNSGIVCVRMKFPGGQTHTHNFDIAASLEELFNVVLVHECCPDNFSLVMGYPPQTLRCEPEWYREYSSEFPETSQISTFQEAGFCKSVVVLVRDNDA